MSAADAVAFAPALLRIACLTAVFLRRRPAGFRCGGGRSCVGMRLLPRVRVPEHYVLFQQPNETNLLSSGSLTWRMCSIARSASSADASATQCYQR
jgi:hypothetical protein